MIDVLRDDHVREQAFAGERFLDRLRRRRRFHDALMAMRAGILGADRFDDHEARGLVLELRRDRFADARSCVAARARLVRLRHVDLDAAAWQMGRQRTPPRRSAAGMAADGRFPRIHLDRLGDRARLVGELLERELQLPRIHALGLLAKQPLTEHVELMPQRRVLALRAS